MHDVLTLILGGGRGARLYPLTKTRSEPAVPIAGKYRLIDIPLSNAINSGLHRIYVLTQYHSVSLHRHIADTYKRDAFSQGFIQVLAAQQTNESAEWYQGTADAIRQNLRYVRDDGARDLLILSGDQLYRMDFRPLIDAHRHQDADLTLAVVPVAADKAADLGVVAVEEGARITRVVEKPQTGEQREPLRIPTGWLEKRGATAAAGRDYLANMGIYLVKRRILSEVFDRQPAATDLVTEIFPYCLAHHKVRAHLFGGYWEDLGTIKTYHEANLALAGNQPPFEFHSPEGVIYTRMRYLPAARTGAAHVEESLISDGCVVEPGARLERCILGVRSRIGRDVSLRNTILLGANYFEDERGNGQNGPAGIPPLGVGANSVLDGVVVDKNCRIGRGVRLENRRGLAQADAEHYVIRDGIIVIPNGTAIPDGMEI